MKIYILVLLVSVCVSCFGQTKVEQNIEYKSVSLTAGDSTFLALKDTAQKYIGVFIDSLKTHGRDNVNYSFSIKSDFVENGIHEHMWSQVFLSDKNILKGVFIDSPFKLKNIKTGDKVTIKLSDVEDWIMEDLKRNTKKGYFSEKYLDSKE